MLDGAWLDAEAFWWPFLGLTDVLGVNEVSGFERDVPIVLVMELVGLAALTFLVRRLDLLGEGRELFKSKGQILRERLEE